MQKPPLGTLLGRAFRLRCPRCGMGKLFRSFFRMHERCESCDLKYERAPGYFLGSIYINYGLTAMSTTIAYVTLHFGKNIPNKELMPYLIGFCVIFPTLFYRYARALWISLDSFFDTQEFWSDES